MPSETRDSKLVTAPRGVPIAGGAPPNLGGEGFWHELINEKAAAEFLNISVRTVQAKRQKGGGPRYVRLSSRCIRYRRADLRKWTEERLVTSTSDPGLEGRGYEKPEIVANPS